MIALAETMYIIFVAVKGSGGGLRPLRWPDGGFDRAQAA
jgi:hypothetical protein